jgi:hypothetical protein
MSDSGGFGTARTIRANSQSGSTPSAGSTTARSSSTPRRLYGGLSRSTRRRVLLCAKSDRDRAVLAAACADCLLDPGNRALGHRQCALRATAALGHQPQLAGDAHHVERDPQLGDPTVAVLMEVDTVELPAAARRREPRRFERTRVRSTAPPVEGGAAHPGSRRARQAARRSCPASPARWR